MTLLILDKTEESKLRDLFTLFGTPFKGTRLFWINPPLMIIAGIIVAFAFAPVADTTDKIVAGIVYGLFIILAGFIHSFGHIISSRRVGAPVTYIIMSMTVSILHFDDNDDLPSRVHIGRSIGGPLASLLAGIAGLVFYMVTQSHFLAFFAVINFLYLLVAIAPIPTVDGAVILREIRNSRD